MELRHRRQRDCNKKLNDSQFLSLNSFSLFTLNVYVGKEEKKRKQTVTRKRRFIGGFVLWFTALIHSNFQGVIITPLVGLI